MLFYLRTYLSSVCFLFVLFCHVLRCFGCIDCINLNLILIQICGDIAIEVFFLFGSEILFSTQAPFDLLLLPNHLRATLT